MSGTAWPAPRTAWTLTLLLTVAYILSYIDRSILGLLVQPIKADLGVSDEQMGYLIGWAFGLFYATIGLPLGWLADRRRRTRIVAAGVALWSLATVASGLVRSFGGLFGARMGVGVGEATLSPCAMSLIGDSFPPERRGKPVGVYSAALAFGAGIAGLLSASLLSAVTSDVVLPIVGAVRPWQFAFIIVGVPGLLLAPLFLLLPEPARTMPPGTPASGFGEALAYVRSHLGALGGVTLLVAVMTTIAYSHGFNAAAFARTYGWPAKDYARVNGLVNLVVGPLTVIGVGWLADRWRRAGRTAPAFSLLAAGFVLMLPVNAVALFMPTPELAIATFGLGSVGIGTVTAAGIIALLEIVPARMRGQLVALYYMAISIAGLGLGPTTVGILSTRVFGEANLREALASIPILYGAVPLLLLPLIARAYRAELRQ